MVVVLVYAHTSFLFRHIFARAVFDSDGTFVILIDRKSIGTPFSQHINASVPGKSGYSFQNVDVLAVVVSIEVTSIKHGLSADKAST